MPGNVGFRNIAYSITASDANALGGVAQDPDRPVVHINHGAVMLVGLVENHLPDGRAGSRRSAAAPESRDSRKQEKPTGDDNDGPENRADWFSFAMGEHNDPQAGTPVDLTHYTSARIAIAPAGLRN